MRAARTVYRRVARRAASGRATLWRIIEFLWVWSLPCCWRCRFSPGAGGPISEPVHGMSWTSSTARPAQTPMTLRTCPEIIESTFERVKYGFTGPDLGCGSRGTGRTDDAERSGIAVAVDCKSVRRLAEALQQQGHQVSRTLVGELLNATGYSLQGNRKTKEGDSHPDRDAQFAHINTQVAAALAEQQPVISVDTKKKELVGEFGNNGREYRPQGCPEEVRVHDFLIKELGRAVPYGVYDLAANAGWVSVGIDHDTAAFAVNSIRQWWLNLRRARYSNATRLLITADGGGSNGSRVRLWK